MISYIEKGYGLHQMLAAQGIELRNVDGIWIANAPDEHVSQLIAEYNPWPFEKALKLVEINEAFQNAVNQLTVGTTEAEQKSWHIQEREAREYPNKHPVALQRLADVRGIPLEELVSKVLQKANLYQDAYFTLQGMRDKAEDKIKSFPDYNSYEKLGLLHQVKFE